MCQALLRDSGPCPYCLLRENACKHMRARAVSRAQGDTPVQKTKSRGKSSPSPALERCPECRQKTLMVENGCYQCLNPECLYSKCSVI